MSGERFITNYFTNYSNTTRERNWVHILPIQGSNTVYLEMPMYIRINVNTRQHIIYVALLVILFYSFSRKYWVSWQQLSLVAWVKTLKNTSYFKDVHFI